MEQTKKPDHEFKIQTESGERTVTVRLFDAMEGWIMKSRFLDYATASNEEFKREYTVRMLSMASVDGQQIDSKAAVNGLLENWQNLELVFERVCSMNGIDTAMTEERKIFYKLAGADMAAGFVAEALKLVEPLLQIQGKRFDTQESQDNG